MQQPLTELAQEQYQNLISEIALRESDQVQQDIMTWNWTKDGRFTVKTFYDAMEQGPYIQQKIYKIWKLKAPTRVTIFTWLMIRNKILTVDNLVKRGWNMVNRCCLCKSQEETVHHLFADCNYTRATVAYLMDFYTALSPNGTFARGNYRDCVLNIAQQGIARLQMTTCFVIWRERCRRIFSDKTKEPQYLAFEIVAEVVDWFGEGTPTIT